MKICVGLSGGVDSSVAALLLKQQGYDVFAMFMQNWHDADATLHGDCEWEEDRFVAEMVARKIGIPFYFVDLSEQYRQRVVDYMFDEYARGRTPNPDVLCNREIKFDAFLAAAKRLGADFVATGHYVRKSVISSDVEKSPSSFHGSSVESVAEEYLLLEGVDPNKDQSYFLCQLSQAQLATALFPIGDITKPEVRRIAREAGLPSAEKKDSQGICFVGKVDLPVFLQQQIASKEGDIVEIFRDWYAGRPGPATLQEMAEPIRYRREDGKVIGRHIGAQYYTIGQHKGLGIGGHAEPAFVIANDMEENIIFVGEGHGHPGLWRRALRIRPDEVHWIRPDLALSPGETCRYTARIRYRQPLQGVGLHCQDDGLFLLFDEPQWGITPGQFAVWYAPDGEMVGSGVIDA